MNKPKDKIEELFQRHSDDFDKMPDDSLWDNIEANLPPVATPVRRLLRWGLAAALLLFSLAGYMVYESFTKGQENGGIVSKENIAKGNANGQKSISKKDTKTALEANESNLAEEHSAKAIASVNEAENDKKGTDKSITLKDKGAIGNKVEKWQKNKISVAKSSELVMQKENPDNTNEKQIITKAEADKQIVALIRNNREVKENQLISEVIEESSNEQNIIAKEDDVERLSGVDYLPNRNNISADAIPLNTQIVYEAEYQVQEKKESFFKGPSEIYISLTPSLNYYRVFANSPINQFNGARNGGRLGWAVQAGAVYPLKIRRLSYRVGLSYFSAQSNFSYNMVNRTQMPIRLNNNTFEYVNVESAQSESKKWQVLEIQNDLMYKVRPMQDFIAGFKAGSSFTEKPVFDAYMGYRFNKQVSNRQILWIEAAYAYAINAQQSSYNTFSYHMDKYSLRIGLNFK